MAVASDGSYKCSGGKDGKHEANELEKASGVSGQDGPDAVNQNASYTTSSDRLSCIGEGRGRLRDLDRHASWREVYAAMEVRTP